MEFNPITAPILFPAMILLQIVGRRMHTRRRVKENSTIEAAIFALFGLLLGFTFSGAMGRFDAHRQLVNQEVNAIGTAYLRLDL